MLFRRKKPLKKEAKPSTNKPAGKKITHNTKRVLKPLRHVLTFLKKVFLGIIKFFANAGGLFRNTRIQVRLIVILLLVSFVPLTITALFSFTKSSSAIENKTKVSTSEIVKLVAKNLQFEINRYQNLYNEILSDEMIQRFLASEADKEIENSIEYKTRTEPDLPYVRGLRAGFTREGEEELLTTKVANYLEGKIIGAPNANGVIFITKKFIINNSYVSISGRDTNFADQLKELADQADGRQFWALVRHSIDNGVHLVTGKKVRSILPEYEGKEIGYLFLVMFPAMLNDVIRDINMGEGSQVYIFTADGTNIANTNEENEAKLEPFSDSGLLEAIVKHETESRETADSYAEIVPAFPTNVNSEKTLVAYTYYPELEWYIVGTVPYSYLQNETRAVGWFIALITVICLVVAVVFSLLIAISISTPLKKMVSIMKQVKEGDLTVNINDRGRDEISEVIRNLNEMVSNIKQLIAKVHASAQKVLSNSDEISILSERSHASSEQIALTIQEIAKGASEQAAEIAQGVNYMNNLADGINRVGSEMANVSGVVTTTRSLSQEALSAVKTLNDKAVETDAASKKIVDDIMDLSNDMKEIKKIVKMIVQIADQTNLLSLNAAIEAARAGEAGRGFAVVADEVKKLADQSKVASININDIITRILQKTELTVNTATNASEIVNQQMEAVHMADNAFNTILTAMEGISNQIESMKEAVETMISSKDSALSSIENISAVSQESAATAEEVSASTEEQMAGAEELAKYAKDLRDMAQELADAISAFKVE